MNIILWICIITFIAGVCGTGFGGVVAAIFRSDSKKIVSLLLSFAAGVMLSVVCFDLITEALKAGGRDEGENLLITTVGIAVGFIVIYVLNRLIDKATDHEVKHIDETHPKTADSLEELIHSNHYEVHKQEKNSLFMAGVVMMVAIALHNLPEGMVIGASFAKSSGSELYSGSGLALAVVIGLHNIPEGMAVAVPLISGGMKRSTAIVLTAASGAPTIIGAVLGYSIGVLSPIGLSLSLSFASGAMLYVVFGELLPEVILMWKSKAPAFASVFGMIIGLIVIYC